MPQAISRIPKDVRSSIRFFAFFIGNGSLGATFNEFPEYSKLFESEDFLPKLVAVFLNCLDVHDMKSIGPAQRCAWQYLKTRLDPSYHPDDRFGKIITDPELHQDYRQDICKFAQYLAVETIPRSPEWLYGSGVESMFAVYCNVVELNSKLRVSNHKYACDRVELMVTSDHCVLEDWETELH